MEVKVHRLSTITTSLWRGGARLDVSQPDTAHRSLLTADFALHPQSNMLRNRTKEGAAVPTQVLCLQLDSFPGSLSPGNEAGCNWDCHNMVVLCTVEMGWFTVTS